MPALLEFMTDPLDGGDMGRRIEPITVREQDVGARRRAEKRRVFGPDPAPGQCVAWFEFSAQLA
jgi:hypothetical protein